MADQGSLFDKRAKQAKPPRVGPSEQTADRGHGAPAPHVAREAVRTDAVDHGSADPDSLWVQQKRARSKRAAEEHRAIGADHAELFVFTPGSQLVASKAVDPFKGFSVQWDRARDAALAGYGGLDERRVRLFLSARSVAATPEDEGHRVTVDLAGYRFTATGETLLDALDALSRRTAKGIERAEGRAPKEAVAPSAIELANARRSPEERLQRDAYAYFTSRKLTFTKSRDRHLSFALTDEDVRRAGLIGIAGPSDRAAHDAIVTFFQAIDARTAGAALVACPSPALHKIARAAPALAESASASLLLLPASTGKVAGSGPASSGLALLLVLAVALSVGAWASVGWASVRDPFLREPWVVMPPTAYDPPSTQAVLVIPAPSGPGIGSIRYVAVPRDPLAPAQAQVARHG